MTAIYGILFTSFSTLHFFVIQHTYTQTKRRMQDIQRPCRRATAVSKRKNKKLNLKHDLIPTARANGRKHGVCVFPLGGHLQLKSELMLTN